MINIFSFDEIESFRKDTPGCKNRIHLNNAGAGLMPQPVVNAVINHTKLEAEIGGYEASDMMEVEIFGFYESAAKLINCKTRNIAFTSSATDSFTRAVSSIPFKKGDIILTTNEDYISNQIAFLSLKKRFGVKLERAASLEEGGVDLDSIKKKIIKHKPRLVAVTHIPTNSGLIQPVAEIGSLCRKYNTLYLIDACQSIGQLKIDVEELQCDFLSVTCRKFLRGPRGSGFLYVSDRVLESKLEPLFIDMRGAEWIAPDKYMIRDNAMRFEDWEFAYATVLGSKAAIDYLLKLEMQKVEATIKSLSGYIRSRLYEIQNVNVHDAGSNLGGLVTFSIKNGDPYKIKKSLYSKGINVVESFRNFAVIDFDWKGVSWAIRASPHYFNSSSEIEFFTNEIEKLAK